MDPIVVKTPDGAWEITLNVAPIGVVVPPVPPVPPPVPPTPTPNAEPVIPASAGVVDLLPAAGWKQNWDKGTPGSATGSYVYPTTLNGATVAKLAMNLVKGGGYIYHKQGLKDGLQYKNYCYEVDSEGNWPDINNEETDIEHVNAAGVPLDMATQIASVSGTVEITKNHHWTPTGVKAKVNTRADMSRHTKKIYVKVNPDDTVTYVGIKLDDVYYPIGISSPNADSSKWTPRDVNVQLQFDGPSGKTVTPTVYLHTLKVHYW